MTGNIFAGVVPWILILSLYAYTILTIKKKKLQGEQKYLYIFYINYFTQIGMGMAYESTYTSSK